MRGKSLAVLIACFFGALLLGRAAAAGSLEDGQAAYDRGDTLAALGLWQPLAQADDPAAEEKLGEFYVRGHGGSAANTNRSAADVKIAAAWFQRSAEQGNVLAQCYLAAIYLKHAGYDPEIPEFWLLRAQADAASTSGAAAIGRWRATLEEHMSRPQAEKALRLARAWRPRRRAWLAALQAREGEEAYARRDFGAALRLWTSLAKAGDAAAQEGLGRLHLFGLGVPRSYPEASSWLLRAAAQGNARAQFELGVVALQEERGATALAAAESLVLSAAAAGLPEAERLAGAFSEEGLGVAQDPAAAADWYRRAAAQGDGGAERDLARLYALGLGVERDASKSAAHEAEAVRRGDAEAQYLAAAAAPDGAEAVGLLRASAEQGYTPAQRQLASLYEQGERVRRNAEEAAKWLGTAATAGDATAARDLDVVSRTLSPEERRRAKAEAEAWSAAHPSVFVTAPKKAPVSAMELAQAMMMLLIAVAVAWALLFLLLRSGRLSLPAGARRALTALSAGLCLSAAMHMLQSLHVTLGWLNYPLFVLSLPGMAAGCVISGTCKGGSAGQITHGLAAMIAVDTLVFALLIHATSAAWARRRRPRQEQAQPAAGRKPHSREKQ
jgi:TPR repeat protein